MKKAIYLFLTLFLISCSKDDNGGSDEATTFTEKYNGYGFKDGSDYIFISDSTYFLRIVADGECFEWREGLNNFFDLTYKITITKNTPTNLVSDMVVIYNNIEEETFTLDLSVSGNNLTAVEVYEDGSRDTTTFSKTNTTFNSLCN